MIVGLDFETKSRVDLKACGTDVYASDESTDIICCSFISDENHKHLWFSGNPLPEEVRRLLLRADEIQAHNARFDQLIYEYIAVEDYGFPELPVDKWVCTAAQCRVNALPSSLDLAARAVKAKHKKDHSGSALIRKLSIPDKRSGKFNDDPKLKQQMGAYCMKDSLAMQSVVNALRPLTQEDKEDWQINERINDRGVLIDIELAKYAQQYAVIEKKELGEQLSRLTNGHISAVSHTARLLTILRETLPKAHLTAITKISSDGKVKYTLDKAARSQLLDLPDLDPTVRIIVDLVDQGGKSSVSKFTAMINRADRNTGRVHGAFIFAGAGQTQRYSSKGLQLHNMGRDCFNAEETEVLKAKMARGEKIPNVMDTLAKLLRPAIIPAKGCKFVVGDWSAIEAIVLPWLANSKGGDEVLAVFKRGEDIYITTAHAMGLTDRQIGKVANLSLGYGGAVGAFQAMAKNYGLTLEDREVQAVVDKWRRANAWAKAFWSELELAAIRAVRTPERVTEAGRIKFIFVPHLLNGTLMCILPNNTVIQYPHAKIERGGVTAMKASVQPKADSNDEWPRMSLWGGFLAENVTQAVAACLLRELLYDLVTDGFPVIGHVHDEVILEVTNKDIEQTKKELQEYMETAPEWAAGLPLKAVPEVFTRYGK